MTDNEIIKAMQCVIGNGVSCSECEYQKALPFPGCRRMCAENALDLINRQKADIERLKEEKQDIKDKYDCQQTVYCDLSDIIKEKCKELELANADKVIAESHEKAAKKMFVDVVQRLKTIKSEAIKEFAERVKETSIGLEIGDDKKFKMTVVSTVAIDNLVKEMTEEKDES